MQVGALTTSRFLTIYTPRSKDGTVWGGIALSLNATFACGHDTAAILRDRISFDIVSDSLGTVSTVFFSKQIDFRRNKLFVWVGVPQQLPGIRLWKLNMSKKRESVSGRQ